MVQIVDTGGSGELPADLQKTTQDAAAKASSTSKDSYEKIIKVPLIKNKKYSFWFTYLYQDPETMVITEGPRSPFVQYTFDIPNLTKPVINLVTTSGLKCYSVKYENDPLSVQEDIVIFESLTGAFAGEEYIVYVGTSTNVTIQVNSYADRYVKVVVRDKWLDANRSSTTSGVIHILNAEVDTTTAPSAPSGASGSMVQDAADYTGFNAGIVITWTPKTDTNTSGYAIRWSSQNPSVVTNPLWEYGQVDGRSTSRFTVTGALPNTLYYFQVTSISPFNAISWSGVTTQTMGPYVDTTAPSDAWAQLKSILSIGGKTSDLFKIGTGISQSINNSTTTTPALSAGTYSGIILNKSTTNVGHNYWLNTGQFRVGSATSFLYWDGSDVYTTGKINATGGTFTGNLQVTTGSIYAGSLTGARVVMQPSGLFAHDANGVQVVAIQSADGLIDARKGYIGGWTINATSQTSGTISRNNTLFDSNGNITVGDATGSLASIVRLSGTDATYRLWVGSQTASNALFRVDSTGKLYATGAVISGQIGVSSTLSDGTTFTTVRDGAAVGATALQPNGTLTGDVTGKVGGVAVATVTGGASKGTSAVQPGNGVTVDATTKIINKIEASAGMKISSGGTYKAYMDNLGLYMTNPQGQYSIFLDSSSGDAVFRGTVYAAAGEFTGKVTASSGEFTGAVNANSGRFGSASTGWTLASDGTLSNGTAGSTSGTTIFPYASGASVAGGLGSSTNLSYYSNRGIMVYPGSGSAFGYTAIGTNIVTYNGTSPHVSASTSVYINDSFAPNSDNAYSLGFTGNRWQIVRSAGGVSTTSDQRLKKDIQDSTLGLNFIKALRPVSYKFISGGKVYKDNAQKEFIDGVIVEPEMVDRPGQRTHWGFLAQNVKEAIDQCGAIDFAGWQLDDPSDPDSGQSLVHHQFIGPITKSIQELSDMVELLQQEVNTLKGV